MPSAAGHAALMRGAGHVMGRLPASAVGRLTASARKTSLMQAAGAKNTRRPKGHLSLRPPRLTYHGGRLKVSWVGTNGKHCTLSAKPRFWAGRNPARVRCHGGFTVTVPAFALGVHWRFTFKARDAAGRTATVRRTLTLHKPPFAVSSNWSGYVVPSTAPVTSVSGEFTVPTLDCAKTKNAGETAWVGIGGARGAAEDLLQTGVVSECISGVQVENPAWWEEFPESDADLFDSTTMKVSPGDRIQASVSQATDTTWTTRVDDLTTGVSGVMHTGDRWGTIRDSDGAALSPPQDASTVTYSGGGTAEWIVEDFGTSTGLIPFADFGTVTFTGLTTSLPTWALTAPEQVGLGSKAGLLLAAPSAPDSTGRGFSVAYTG